LVEIILLVVLVGLAFGIPFAASRHDTFGRVLIALLLIVGTALTLDGIALAADFHDADGFIDCWPYCSTWQDIVGGTFWWGGMLFLVLVIVAIVSAARSSLRSKSR
jgi:hypothetical protein